MKKIYATKRVLKTASFSLREYQKNESFVDENKKLGGRLDEKEEKYVRKYLNKEFVEEVNKTYPDYFNQS